MITGEHYKELQDLVLDVAISQIGVEENPKGSNWGEDIKKYLKSVGIGFPASWCMAFVYWCYKEAAEKNNLYNPFIRSGGVLNVWRKTAEQFKHTEPIISSVFIMDYGKGLGHTGFVENIEEDIIHTIEGNTNDEGSREGYEVCRRQRQKDKIKGYIYFKL